MGGPIAGTRADLAIIDDPVKSRADAESETLREKVWNWYQADLLTRLKPGGSVALIMTRWHENDLGGRLLEVEADKWRASKLVPKVYGDKLTLDATVTKRAEDMTDDELAAIAAGRGVHAAQAEGDSD